MQINNVEVYVEVRGAKVAQFAPEQTPARRLDGVGVGGTTVGTMGERAGEGGRGRSTVQSSLGPVKVSAHVPTACQKFGQ